MPGLFKGGVEIFVAGSVAIAYRVGAFDSGVVFPRLFWGLDVWKVRRIDDSTAYGDLPIISHAAELANVQDCGLNGQSHQPLRCDVIRDFFRGHSAVG